MYLVGHILEIQDSIWYWPERAHFMKKEHFLWKRALSLKIGHQIFHPSYSIPFLSVFYQMKLCVISQNRAAFNSQTLYWMQNRSGIYHAGSIKSQNLKYNVKQAYIFNLIFVGIPSSLILSVKNRAIKGFLLMDQNLISMMKVICWGSINGWLLSLEFRVSLLKFFPSPEM